MEIPIIHSNMHSPSVQTQLHPQREIPLSRPVDMTQQKSQNQDVIRRKKQGEHLSLGEGKLIEMIVKAQRFLINPLIELQFSIHENTGQFTIKVINTENHEVIEVIRQVLSEKEPDIAGLFVDQRA